MICYNNMWLHLISHSYNWLYEGNNNADVAPDENEFYTTELEYCKYCVFFIDPN